MTKRVLITGGGSAIAQQVAAIWAARGYRMYLIDKEASKAKAAADDLRVRGAGEVWSLGADLTARTESYALLERVKKTMGGIDILLVAHGYLGQQQQAERDLAEAERIIAINFVSAVPLLALVANEMEERGQGVIAVIGSVAGDRGRKSIYLYGAAKGALSIMADGMRHRLAGRGVTVVTIKPGFVITPMTAEIEKKGWLWVKPERVARDIVRAIDQKKTRVYTPWYWRWIMMIIVHLPERIFNKLSI